MVFLHLIMPVIIFNLNPTEYVSQGFDDEIVKHVFTKTCTRQINHCFVGVNPAYEAF